MRFLAGLFVAGLIAFGPIVPASAQSDPVATEAVRDWVEAVMSGDKARLDGILAPEFQIVRTDGTAYGKAAYIAGGFANITELLDIAELVATRTDTIMVVRYVLVIAETVDGNKVQARAPRLTVFRKAGDRWLVSAHANFAHIIK